MHCSLTQLAAGPSEASWLLAPINDSAGKHPKRAILNDRFGVGQPNHLMSQSGRKGPCDPLQPSQSHLRAGTAALRAATKVRTYGCNRNLLAASREEGLARAGAPMYGR